MKIEAKAPRWSRIGLLVLLALGSWIGFASAQTQNLPPKPAGYFTDQAGVVDADTGHAINEQLAQFERETSNQILVVIFPNLPDDASPDQYSIDTANSWKAGIKGKDNGAILFVYVKEHRMFIATGRGLEGALTDAICAEIIRNVITPQFRQEKYADGIEAGVTAMIAASKGEYKGTGRTVNEGEDRGDDSGGLPGWVIALIIFFFIISFLMRRSSFWGVPMIYSGGGWGGGGGFGGGSGGGGGGGFSGFSGGGGGFAGGGAGGGW